MNEREGAGKGRDGQSVLRFWFYSNTYNRFTAVSFQLTLIGNDPSAFQLLIDLVRDPDLGNFIDMLPLDFNPRAASGEDGKWWVVCHNLLFLKRIDLKRKSADFVLIFEKIAIKDLARRDLT